MTTDSAHGSKKSTALASALTGLVALTLTACAGPTAVATRPMDQLVSQQANPASDITQPCQNPVELVAAPSGGDVLRNWSKDRAALLDCREKRAALWGYVQGRGAGLSNATPANPPKPGG